MLMGARLARLMRAPTRSTFLFFIFIVMQSCMVMTSFGVSDKEILLTFKESLANTKAINNWDPNVNPCNENRGNWIGIKCHKGHVRGLQLENMGLMGNIDIDALVSSQYLRTLSFMNNTFAGSMPSFNKLTALRSVYLSFNHFNGEIPDDAFVGMKSLKKVLLANNEFTGKIPSSLAALPKILVLSLDGNKFEGQIPDFLQKSLRKFNVSNNNLEGQIPASLSNMDPNSFSGNANLCGSPLESCKKGGKKLSVFKITAIVVMVVLVAAVIIAVFFIFYFKKKSKPLERTSTLHDKNWFDISYSEGPEPVEPTVPVNTGQHKVKSEHGKLTFVRDDREKFDLEDLLRASAEILGSATFGSSYKAMIMNDQVVVVKRYKHMNIVGREEFDEHMTRLGSLSHPNLLPLVAYYYRKEEKLLISDFVVNGSLASVLHGNHYEDKPALDWPTRLRIIKGVARGLAYLYDVIPSLIIPHGHLKSSNVLLDESMDAILADYALSPVISLDLVQQIMMAYKSPEFAQHGRITKKTDIWSLGILILEILTGKFPENYLTHVHDRNADLASWVNTMIKEKLVSDVFDLEMGGAKNSKSEILKLLKIGLSCCEEDVERRLDINEVVRMIEELKEGDGDSEYISSVTNDGDNFRGM
ncbi:pollen receptor-like kinase 4 [Quercus robur]|uniref:pollen receptor-like kinase 4 n=1 Tax=Quercus robur TaxID=38942 RepID=UPI002162ED3F|nr:pollen receptor-like kinase 4 [Quercus robur]